MYPIKGFRECHVDAGLVTGVGFEFDRRFCVQRVHRDPETKQVKRYETLMLQRYLSLVQFRTHLEYQSGKPDDTHIIVTYAGTESPDADTITWTGSEYQIRVPAVLNCTSLEECVVNLQASPVTAYDVGGDYAAWFSSFLGFETRFLYVSNNSRAALGTLAPHSDAAMQKAGWGLLWKMLPAKVKPSPERLVFNDIGQYLLVTKESNDAVTALLDDGYEMDITKFRPNIIVSGSPGSFVEDYWAEVYFPRSDVYLTLTSNCPRCQSITADYKTGKLANDDTGKIWKKLNRVRRIDKGFKYNPIFGRYGFIEDVDIGKQIRPGDEVWVTKKNTTHTVYGESDIFRFA